MTQASVKGSWEKGVSVPLNRCHIEKGPSSCQRVLTCRPVASGLIDNTAQHRESIRTFTICLPGSWIEPGIAHLVCQFP